MKFENIFIMRYAINPINQAITQQIGNMLLIEEGKKVSLLKMPHVSTTAKIKLCKMNPGPKIFFHLRFISSRSNQRQCTNKNNIDKSIVSIKPSMQISHLF